MQRITGQVTDVRDLIRVRRIGLVRFAKVHGTQFVLRKVKGLGYLPKNEFVIEKVGRADQRQFQDIGIEYYRYVS